MGPLTLAEYVRRRNGVPLGAPGSLGNMLSRSFGASSFAGFWRYWNPIFGYALARYVHSPLLRVLPRPPAVIMTFALCGAVHDLVTTLVRGSVAFLFTPWFALLGTGVVVGTAAGMDLSERPWWLRAVVHTGYLVACLAVAVGIRRVLSLR